METNTSKFANVQDNYLFYFDDLLKLRLSKPVSAIFKLRADYLALDLANLKEQFLLRYDSKILPLINEKKITLLIKDQQITLKASRGKIFGLFDCFLCAKKKQKYRFVCYEETYLKMKNEVDEERRRERKTNQVTLIGQQSLKKITMTKSTLVASELNEIMSQRHMLSDSVDTNRIQFNLVNPRVV